MKRIFLSVAVLSFLSPAPVLAQPGVIMNLGQTCSGGNLVAASTLPPTVGMTLPLAFENMPSTPGGLYVIIGFNKQIWAGFPLPLDLGIFGIFPNCHLYVSGDLVVPWSNPGGFVTFPLSIPNDPSLAWLDFGVQGIVMAPGSNPAGLKATNALWGNIGT